MKRKEPILFDLDRPLAHYERAHKLKQETDAKLKLGKIFSVAAFAIGVVCVVGNPAIMAAMALFGLIFCVLSLLGCWLRIPIMCLISIPLGLVAAVSAALSGSEFAPFGAAAFLAASGMQVIVLAAIENFRTLRELPGFPFFDPSMDNLSFVAKERFGAEEFIDESRLYEEKTAKYVPLLEPSQIMDELTTEEEISSAEKNNQEAPDGEKQTKVWEQESHRQYPDISDVDLFE